METLTLIIALTIFGEAAGESLEGKHAVASVIWHRAKGDRSRYEMVCRRPKQFSCWNTGTPKVPADKPSQKAFSECLAIAQTLVNGTFEPLILADHYHATGIKPSWSRKMPVVATIGGHIFYYSR